MARVETLEKITMRRFESAANVIEKTRAIRRKISAASGAWDAVKVLRGIRYAK